VLPRDDLGLVDVLERDRLEQVLLDERLQPDEQVGGVRAATRLDIARYVFRSRRVQHVVRMLVAVGVEDDVSEVGELTDHVRASRFCGYGTTLFAARR
jgi:hypothetical protein